MGEWGRSDSRPGRFIPGERAFGTHWIGGSVGPRSGLEVVAWRRNPCACRESNPGRPTRGLVIILIELSGLLYLRKYCKISKEHGSFVRYSSYSWWPLRHIFGSLSIWPHHVGLFKFLVTDDVTRPFHLSPEDIFLSSQIWASLFYSSIFHLHTSNNFSTCLRFLGYIVIP
jgi:hypothetical protein